MFDNANAHISHRETEATSCSLAVWRHVPDEARVNIEDMNEEDAISLLLKSASLDGSRTELREAVGPIAEEPLFLPLAVHQAGASIASGLFHIDDYLRMYSQHRQNCWPILRLKGHQIAFLGTSLTEMDFKRSGYTIVTLSGGILYILARAITLVLASTSLSDLPPGAYETFH